MFDLSTAQTILLILCIVCACGFEFVNGFHDTANAVATVIYTNSLKPWVAVIWSGICNFSGVMVGGIAVAVGIINLLPTAVLTDGNVYDSIAMILALLFSAIIWNLGTWYFGIPASSSHTLIGSILGIGISYSLLHLGGDMGSVNWKKASEIGLSLLVSPLVGFGSTVLLMYLMKWLVKNPSIFEEPDPKKSPPAWIRGILILTCSGVSFSHGSNDGQKGVGLVMLILIAIVPFHFAINSDVKPQEFKANATYMLSVLEKTDSNTLAAAERKKYTSALTEIRELGVYLKASTANDIKDSSRFNFRKDVVLINKQVTGLLASKKLNVSETEKKNLEACLKGGKIIEGSTETKVKGLNSITDYAPRWVVLMISLSLGLGTMVGWKRIVQTIGEKIGKSHLTYAQGASAELVASSTIGLASGLGLPVSTTHVLSSGIAGSMVAAKGLSNLQQKTVRNILLAWLFTLPVTILLSGLLYALFTLFI